MTLVSPGKPARTKSEAFSCETENQLETIYTCPDNCRSEVTMLHTVNANGNTTINIYWYRDSLSDSFSIIGSKNMSTGEYILLTGATLVLEPGDKIQAMPTGNATPNVDILLTCTETFLPVG